MINLVAFIPNENDATSYYRGSWPIQYLKKRIPDLSITVNPTVGHASLIGVDVLFMQRPCTQGHVAVANMANEMGIPIWIDYDDDLFSVPRDNPNHGYYADPQIQANMIALICLARVISVSTETLKTVTEARIKNKHVVVIPNAFDDYGPLLSRRRTDPSKKGVISWRGTSTHQRDLETFKKQIWDADATIDGLSWHFFGHYPWDLCDDGKIKTFKHYPMASVLNYHESLQRVRPSIHIVPLHDSQFNRCKSNIAWIEASYAGAVTMAPAFPEWTDGSICEMWSWNTVETVNTILGGDHKKLADTAWSIVMDTLRLSQINSKREDLIKTLVHHA